MVRAEWFAGRVAAAVAAVALVSSAAGEGTITVGRLEARVESSVNSWSGYHGFDFTASVARVSRRVDGTRALAADAGEPDVSVVHAELQTAHTVRSGEVRVLETAWSQSQTRPEYRDGYLIVVSDSLLESTLVLEADSAVTLDLSVTLQSFGCEVDYLWVQVVDAQGEIFFTGSSTTARLALEAGRYRVNVEGWSFCPGVGWDSGTKQSVDLRLTSPDAVFALPRAAPAGP